MNLVDTLLDNDGLLTLTLNREDKLNALSLELLNAFEACLVDAAHNPKVKALLITGRGRAFCAGADIERLAACNAESGHQFALHGQRIFRALETLGKPSLAAINGFAFGGGLELAMSASIRIASNDAKMGQPEVKLGVIPGFGGTQRLARLVGKGRALDLCLTGRTIDAETALQYGLISEVVLPDRLLLRAKTILKDLMALAPLAIKSILETIDSGDDMSLDDAMRFEAVHFAKVVASEDKNEGVQAFLTKRTPQFKGV